MSGGLIVPDWLVVEAVAVLRVGLTCAGQLEIHGYDRPDELLVASKKPTATRLASTTCSVRRVNVVTGFPAFRTFLFGATDECIPLLDRPGGRSRNIHINAPKGPR